MPDMIPAWINEKLQPVEKLSVHERGLRHQAVSVFVMKGDLLLIQQRALSKYHTPGLWANTCCTHPHWGEDPATCADRRLQEELGLEGLSCQYRGQVEYNADVGGGLHEHEVVDLFLAHADEGTTVTPNPAEVMDYRWVTLNTLQAQIKSQPERFTPWLRIYLAHHAAVIFSNLAG